MTRYVVVGAGAVGGTIGARLAQAGHAVVLVARGEHGRVLAEDGLLLRAPDGETRVRVPVWNSPDEATLRADDVMVLATKTQDAAAALERWADVPVRAAEPGDATSLGAAGDLLPLVLATNGTACEQIAARWFRRVYGMCVWSPCAQLVPGEVIARLAPESGVYHVSRVPAALTDGADAALLATLQADWAASRLVVHVPDDVMPWKYRKLLGNLANVVEALLGRDDDGELGGGDAASAIIDAAVAEARGVLAVAGIEVTDDATETAVRAAGPKVGAVAGAPEGLGGSTWQSLTKGSASVETDYLNGEIVAIAHRMGESAPINATLARLGREAARAGRRPGEVSGPELLGLLGL